MGYVLALIAFIVGFLGVITSVVMLIISVIKRSGKKKIWGVAAGSCFGLFVIAAVLSPTSGDNKLGEQQRSTTLSATPTLAANVGKSVVSPVPLGLPLTYQNEELTVVKFRRISDSAIVTVRWRNLGNADHKEFLSVSNFRIVGRNKKIYGGLFETESRTLKAGEYLGGSNVIGDISVAVDAKDTDLVLMWHAGLGTERYFKLE